MRHWLLIFMIVLIPLRGWTGGAMSLSLSHAPVGTTAPCHSAATSASALTGDHHSDQGFLNMATGEPANGVAQHSGCTACDICNGSALAQPAQIAGSSTPSSFRSAPAAERFDSAVPQRGNKPPIA